MKTVMARQVLDHKDKLSTVKVLQASLVDLIDLALQGKRAHWNVVGPNFRSVHLQLDEVIADTRSASDEVAERIATLGTAANGRANGVATASRLTAYPDGFQTAPETVHLVADRLATTIQALREAIEHLESTDPVSQDLLISVAARLEKHLWMVQAQEA